MSKRALIAMSGGVDSSAAALLCIKSGYDCAGATMRLYKGSSDEKACGSLKDIEDARAVCKRLSVEHHTFDFGCEFEKEVISRFISTYEAGATPNPCIDCNRHMKFGYLIDKAISLGFDYVATGHYARIVCEGGRFLLKKGVDESKDQSYVLYSLTQKQLSHTLFPLGDFKKTEIRKIAEDNGFINAKKHDSQDICFVPDGDYAAFIEKYTGHRYPCGDFVTRDGKKLGTHNGIIRYTVGQRKGLGLALPSPMYVCEKDILNNRVVLCGNEELFEHEFDVADFNWIAFDTPPHTFRANVKVRYKHNEQPATVTVTGENTVHIAFDTPQRAIAKGQSAVLYDGDTVLGGGKII